MEKLKILSQLLLAAGLLALSIAIVSFTLEVSKVRQDLPAVIAQLDSLVEKLEPAVNSVEQIGQKIPSIVAQIEQVQRHIPAILAEVAEVRHTIPSILAESKSIRQDIPQVLTRVDNTLTQAPNLLAEVENVRLALPAVSKSLDKAAQSINQASVEVAKLTPQIPGILKELEQVRLAAPQILVQANQLVVNAKDIGAEAGQGAVEGIIGGILRSPFSLVSGLGDSLSSRLGIKQGTGLTEDDLELVSKATELLVTSGKIGDSQSWKNKDNGNSGLVSLKNRYKKSGKLCYDFEQTARSKKSRKIKSDFTYCVD